MQTPAQAGNRASKPEHYQAEAGTQLRMGSNLASVATNEHTHPCIFCCFFIAVPQKNKAMFTLLDWCVSSLRRGHANLLCVVPILTDDPRRESKKIQSSVMAAGPRKVLQLLSTVSNQLFHIRDVFKLTWLVLGEDPAARSHRVEQFTAL